MNWMSEFASRQRRSAFKKNYISRLLPIIVKIRQQRSACSAGERLRAVKSAVDMSLALTAEGMGHVGIRWRRALSKRLLCRKRSRNKALLQSQRFPTRRLLFGRKSAFLTRSVPKERASYHGFDHAMAGKQKMNTLRLLIPGGAAMNSACFLKEASCYIVALEMQVEALQALAKTMQT